MLKHFLICVSNNKTFQRTHEHLVETGSCKKGFQMVEYLTASETDLVWVLHLIKDLNSSSSTWCKTVENMSHAALWKLLHGQFLYPYYLQRRQGLTEADFPSTKLFCTWLWLSVFRTSTFCLPYCSLMKQCLLGWVENFQNTYV